MYIYLYMYMNEKGEQMSGEKSSTEKNRKTEPKFFFLWYKARMDPMCSFYVQTTSARSETGTPTKHSSTIHTPGMGIHIIYIYIYIHTMVGWTEWRAKRRRKKSERIGELFENWWRICMGLLCTSVPVSVPMHVCECVSKYACMVTGNLALVSLLLNANRVNVREYTLIKFFEFVFVFNLKSEKQEQY